MIGIVFAVLGAATLGAAMGSSATKSKLLSKPAYTVVLTFANGKLGYLTGTLIAVWENALYTATESKSSENPIVTMVLKAPDGSTMRTWPNK